MEISTRNCKREEVEEEQRREQIKFVIVHQINSCLPFSVPQSGEENHQNDYELQNFNLIKDADAVMILEVLDALLQVIGYL